MARDPEKSARRSALREQRRELAAGRDAGADAAALASHVIDLLQRLELGAGAVVTSYASVPGEPPTGAVNDALASSGIRVLLPVTLPDLDLDWCVASDPLETRLGLDAVAAADLVLAPGLAVDSSGTRMGQGGGCYDRALPRRHPGVPVVVLLHPGEVLGDDEPPLPRREHDQPVDAVVTADGLVDLGLSRRRPQA